MTPPPLRLTGHLKQSDTEILRQQAMVQIATGGLFLSDEGLDSIEVGPLQVLLCAASQARQLGLPCQLETSESTAVEKALASVRLSPATRFFTLVPFTKKAVQQ
jgi:hypothetical protein